MGKNIIWINDVVAAVGTLLGAMTGALIGQETESGFVRGAAVGAISGAVFSIEVFESSLILWQSDESGIGCLLYLVSNLDFSWFSSLIPNNGGNKPQKLKNYGEREI